MLFSSNQNTWSWSKTESLFPGANWSQRVSLSPPLSYLLFFQFLSVPLLTFLSHHEQAFSVSVCKFTCLHSSYVGKIKEISFPMSNFWRKDLWGDWSPLAEWVGAHCVWLLSPRSSVCICCRAIPKKRSASGAFCLFFCVINLFILLFFPIFSILGSFLSPTNTSYTKHVNPSILFFETFFQLYQPQVSAENSNHSRYFKQKGI